ncbi:MAG: Eco57I restriction-modification methylase domain-containing protein, partial [Gammaproteobacteria bacterium]
MPAPATVVELVNRFGEQIEAYKSGNYKEHQVRVEFIDPLFEALGWDIYNKVGNAEAYKDVIHEDAVKIGGFTKAPDYCFRVGGTRKFFLEAKKPSVNIKDDVGPAYQLRRYSWSSKLALGIVTDFEEFAVYDCRVRPQKMDKASVTRIAYYTYQEYVEKWDEIAARFSKDAVYKGSFDRYAETNKLKKGTAQVDDAFLGEIEAWREALAKNLALRNPELSQRELNFAVQRSIDRIIFLRICEDRGIDQYGRLQGLLNGSNTYKRLTELFRDADDRYNSGLFHFKEEKERDVEPDTLTLSLKIDDDALKDILKNLYPPDSPYEFSVLPADILGQVYEQFLGKVIRLTEGHHAKIEEKPEVRKAGGVYYTPRYIVDYIVKNTVGKLLEGKTPKEAAKLRILDPACGSGSFLIQAYQYLLDWHRDWYANNEPEKHAKGKNPAIYRGAGNEWRLTTSERKRILLNNIYGVDIDSQAVEVTKLSLLLKVLEGESEQSLNQTFTMFHERALPDLQNNIKCGNSLIGSDFYEGQQIGLLDDEERNRINAFDWQAEFTSIFKQDGFDTVIGNPPYIDSEWMTEFLSKERTYLTEQYSAATGNWDIFCVFIERSMQLCRKGGLSSMIVPNKLGSANYASGARSILTTNNELLLIRDYSSVRVFPVSVYPIIYVAKKTKPFGTSIVNYERMKVFGVSEEYELDYSKYFLQPNSPWRIFSNLKAENPAERLRKEFPELRSIATVLGAATVSEAYNIQPLIENGDHATTALKLINSGTIDRYNSLWGHKECRYLGKSYLYPVVDSNKVDSLPTKRREQARTPKII